MFGISKLDSRPYRQRLLDFLTDHEFMGVENARRVFDEGESDLWLASDGDRLIGALLSVDPQNTTIQANFIVSLLQLLADHYRRPSSTAPATLAPHSDSASRAASWGRNSP